MKKILSWMVLLLVMLMCAACTGGSEARDLENDPGRQVGGIPEDAVTMCDAAQLEGAEVTWSGPELAEVLSGDALADVLGMLRGLSEDTENAVLFGQEGCYVSCVGLKTFLIGEMRCSDTVLCFVFTRDMEPAAEILVADSDGRTNGSLSFYMKGETPYWLSVLAEIPELGFIRLSNGYNQVLLDENNLLDKPLFTVKGDYFHALDHEAMAVTYNDIVNPENLVWIAFE